MKNADPNLVRRRIDVKLDLTAEQKVKRKTAAEKLWQMFQRDPDMLSRIYFIDECKIWMSSLAKGPVKVYCDAHDENVTAVLPCKWMRKYQDVKLHSVCAVDPVHGAVLQIHNRHHRHHGPCWQPERTILRECVLQCAAIPQVAAIE
jgi:hypothetical protein